VVGLSSLFVAAGTKVGDEIIRLRFLQDLYEGRHRVAAFEYLRPDLAFAQSASYTGEVGPLRSTILPDFVTVLASVFRKDRCPAGALVAGRCGERNNGRHD
jgi:hypothetical protein